MFFFCCCCLSFFAHLFLLGNGNYKEITKTNHRGRLHHGVQSARWWKLFLPRGRTSTRIQGWHVKIAHFEFKGPLNAFVNLAIFLSLWRLYLWINLKFQEKRPSLLSELAAVNGARYFRGAKTPRIKLMRLSFFFFRNKSGTFVKSSSLPSRRSFRHAIFPSIPWRGKGDCVTGQKRLPSRVTRTSRSRALGESLLSVFQGW